MKHLNKVKLNQLAKADLAKREMNALLGGAGCCGCGCYYEGQEGGSTTSANGSANRSHGYDSDYGGIAYGYSS